MNEQNAPEAGSECTAGLGRVLEPFKGWAFAWTGVKRKVPFITRFIHYTRRECIQAVEAHLGMPWRKIYRTLGGRCIKAEIREP